MMHIVVGADRSQPYFRRANPLWAAEIHYSNELVSCSV